MKSVHNFEYFDANLGKNGEKKFLNRRKNHYFIYDIVQEHHFGADTSNLN